MSENHPDYPVTPPGYTGVPTRDPFAGQGVVEISCSLASRGTCIPKRARFSLNVPDKTKKKRLTVLAVLLIIGLLVWAASAQAQQNFPQDVEVCWTNPSEYVDSSLIETGDLENVRIEGYRQNDTVPAFTGTIPANGEGLDQCFVFSQAIPQPGTYRIEGYAIVIGGIESDPSVPLYKKYVGKPRSIILRTVT